jgi:glycerophosphoryl diester phosphodiesterase
VFAHRGGAQLAPENTLDAFRNGVALGADGLELDVRISRDGEVMVHHDATLDRTTALSGALNQRSAGELRRAAVPPLAEVLQECPHVRVIIELKVNSVECAERTIAVIRGAGAEARVCLGAFGRRVLRRARELAPEIATSAAREEVRWALYRTWVRFPWSRRTGYAGFQVPEHAGTTRVVSPRFIGDAHRAGLGVQVWTVNAAADAHRLLDWGVDALITDRPDIMVPLVQARENGNRIAGARV